MHDTLVGVDLAKAVFQLAISGRPGRFDSHSRLTREQFLPFFAQLPLAVVIMEAYRLGRLRERHRLSLRAGPQAGRLTTSL